MMRMLADEKAEVVRLYAAGSLRAALTEMARRFEAGSGSRLKVKTEFAASGLLRERIERGETAHVFASADTGHPARLAEAGRTLAEPAVFAHNRLCALVCNGLEVAPATLLDTMLDPSVRVGTSTPRADPSGDYAFALFAKAERSRRGAQAMLERKALTLTGGPESQKAPDGRNQYGWVMENGKADIFLTYRTNAILAQREVPSLRIVQVPAALSVEADYGLVVLQNAPPAAAAFARFIQSDEGQTILTEYGFGRGDPAN
jgi:molybdenum ABC transporter molybdate-binding protein